MGNDEIVGIMFATGFVILLVLRIREAILASREEKRRRFYIDNMNA